VVTPRVLRCTLLLKNHRRSADPFSGEADGYLYTVSRLLLLGSQIFFNIPQVSSVTSS
jgi:hypothetical protein